MSVYVKAESSPALWDSVAKKVVLESFLNAQYYDNEERRHLQQALHGFLEGDHKAEVDCIVRELYPATASDWNASSRAHRYFPLIQMYADRLSVVMAINAPDTWLIGPDGERLPEEDPRVRLWRRDQKAIGFSTALAKCERYINSGMRQALIHVAWRRGQPRWDVLAPYEVEVDQDPLDPGRIEYARTIAVRIAEPQESRILEPETLYLSWSRLPTYDELGRETGSDWHVWLHDEHGTLMADPLFGDNVNRYGLHPLVMWRHDDPAAGCVWLPPNEAWYRQQLSADLKLMDLDHHLRHQVHAQLFLRGNDVGSLMDKGTTAHGYGPDRPLVADGADVEATYLTPNPNIDTLIADFNFDLRSSAVAESLPADTWEPNSSTRNLAAKQLEQHALRLRRERVIPYYEEQLRRTFEVHRTVCDYWRREQYGDVELGIEFAPLPEVVDKARDATHYAMMSRANLTSPVRKLQESLGVSRSRAVQLLEQNRADNERYGQPVPMQAAPDVTDTPPSDVG